MTGTTIERLFIAGGYGMIGSNVAIQVRQYFPAANIILAGRHPERGETLAQQLGNATTVQLDLSGKQIPDIAAKAQIIVSAVPDPQNLLAEYAIQNHIPFINITSASGDDVLPLLNLSKIYCAAKPVVPLGYYEAGMFLPLVTFLSRQFKRVDSVEMMALHDPSDPLGELSAGELDNEIPPALMRKYGYWLHSDEQREAVLFNGEKTLATPFNILDVSAVAAMTKAESVRFDVASGLSAGTCENGQPSIDLYVDMKGIDASSKHITKRLLASDAKGQAHFTALGVLTVIKALLTVDRGGFMLPEEFIDFDNALESMRLAGITITQR